MQDDDAVVELIIHKVNGAAGDFYAVLECLLLRVEAWKGRQQRWMNIEDAIGKGGDEVRRQEAHVAGEANESTRCARRHAISVGVMLGARAAFGDENLGRQA